MSIYVARLRKTMTPLVRSCLSCPAKRCVFKSRLKRSDSTAGSCSESGSEFKTVGSATEKARVVPKVLRRNRGIYSLRRLAERCWRLETSETGTQQSARYVGAPYQRHRWTLTASLYCTSCGTVSQCRSSRNSHERPRWCSWVPAIGRAACSVVRVPLSPRLSCMALESAGGVHHKKSLIHFNHSKCWGIFLHLHRPKDRDSLAGWPEFFSCWSSAF